MIAASAPDTIRIAMMDIGLDLALTLLPPGHVDIPEKQRTKHPDKSMYRFAASLSDSATRNKLQQKLGGMVVCAEGILVKLDTPENDDVPAVEAKSTSSAVTGEATKHVQYKDNAHPETPVSMPAAVPNGPLPRTVLPPDSAPVMPLRFKTLIQSFKVNQPEQRDAADRELDATHADYTILNVAAEIREGDYTRVVTMVRFK